MRFRFNSRPSPLVFSLIVGGAGLALFAPTANAQLTGTTSKPVPNVLLLVDTSGSMERASDGSSVDTTCDGSTGNFAPNRWHMLTQALTGNVQAPSCVAVDRGDVKFTNEFQIGGASPLDKDYSLKWHRLMSGGGSTACTVAPYKLPSGGGVGVSSANRTSTGAYAEDFPPDALMQVFYQSITASNGALTPTSADQCSYSQASDGQLDNIRDFIRLGLMTFDSDISGQTGVIATPPLATGNVVSGSPFLGEWSYLAGGTKRQGRPLGCATLSDFDVGARHWAAPPWEGRMVRFPSATADIFELETVNDQIQQVLNATRPYGATPIDGMMDDAADYLTGSTVGPWSGTVATGQDYYVRNGCREQYIILLTDGAPNLDMRPDCQGGGVCPFASTASGTATTLYGNAGGKHVSTFVIGFSVNGTANYPDANNGFPALLPSTDKNCKGWYNNATPLLGGQGDPKNMATVCGTLNPLKGSTAAACCQLNEIALAGTGGPTSSTRHGPYFAEAQSDLSLAFASILAQVVRTASTRTVPGYSPVATISGGPLTGTFVASFIPDAQKPWSGEIDRERFTCSSTIPPAPQPVSQSISQGDSYAYDTARQSVDRKRLFITVKDKAISAGGKSYIDSAGSVRPFEAVADGFARADGAPQAINAKELGKVEDSVDTGVISMDGGNTTDNWDLALGITPTTCKSSRGTDPITKATISIPALTSTADCTKTVWGFTTAAFEKIVFPTSTWDFNVRCSKGITGAAGKCSVSGNSCVIGSATCGVETCVPDGCTALGAVYRSSPVVVGAPASFSSDEGYRAFQAARAFRRPTMFVSTADGILHGFKALPDSAAPLTTVDHEMWAFVPPAILPRLASNYPSGSQILLDGTPAVKDVVWERIASTTNSGGAWHTTLVSGLGINGGGYYGLNVTDADCGNSASSQSPSDTCRNGSGGYQTPGSGALADVSRGGVLPDGATKRGPHFLWQLTDTPAATTGEQAIVNRKALGGTSTTKNMVSLFGKQTGTPAITTLNIDFGGVEKQVGVAILPGGIDGPPVATGTCPRASKGGYGSFPTSDISDSTLSARTLVRQWGASCASPVNGRGVTIVRLDTGEIIKHFGRANQDVPLSLKNAAGTRVKDSPFDAPIIGTPVVYPNTVDTSAQKIFVADADATVWRIDVSSKNPVNWKVELFQDLASPLALGGGVGQPIQIPMSLATTPTGNLVLIAATGDQENLVASSASNWLYSIEELRPTSATAGGSASVRWYKQFTQAERVTGPMVVFDSKLYFATFQPEGSGTNDACQNKSATRIWGMDYLAGTGAAGGGGQSRWCDQSINNPANISAAGACLSGYSATGYEDLGGFTDGLGNNIPRGSLIPGVTVKQTQSCTANGTLPDGPGTGYTSVQPVTYQLAFGVTAPKSAGGLSAGQASRFAIKVPTPRTSTSIDAWSIVVD